MDSLIRRSGLRFRYLINNDAKRAMRRGSVPPRPYVWAISEPGTVRSGGSDHVLHGTFGSYPFGSYPKAPLPLEAARQHPHPPPLASLAALRAAFLSACRLPRGGCLPRARLRLPRLPPPAASSAPASSSPASPLPQQMRSCTVPHSTRHSTSTGLPRDQECTPHVDTICDAPAAHASWRPRHAPHDSHAALRSPQATALAAARLYYERTHHQPHGLW